MPLSCHDIIALIQLDSPDLSHQQVAKIFSLIINNADLSKLNTQNFSSTWAAVRTRHGALLDQYEALLVEINEFDEKEAASSPLNLLYDEQELLDQIKKLTEQREILLRVTKFQSQYMQLVTGCEIGIQKPKP